MPAIHKYQLHRGALKNEVTDIVLVLYCLLWTDLTHYFSAFIIDFLVAVLTVTVTSTLVIINNFCKYLIGENFVCLKGARKSYFMDYMCVVNILLDTDLYKSVFSTYTNFSSFVYCVFCLFCLDFDVILINF